MVKNDVSNGVYVSWQELIQLRLQLVRTKLANQKRVMTPLAGGYSSFFRGRGMDFIESRHYQPGDDIRAIDWRVTARTGKTHTKLFREERERPVFFWVDYRPHTFFGTQVRFKSVTIAYTSAWLAWAATTHGDRIGGIIFSETQIKELRPVGGQRGVLRFIKALVDNQPTQEGDFRVGKFTYIKRVAQHNDILAIFVYDPLEKAFPSSFKKYDVSNGQQILTFDGTNSQINQLYQQRFEQHSAHLETFFKQQGSHWFTLATNDRIADTLQYHLSYLWKHV